MKQKRVLIFLLACLFICTLCLPVFAENEVDISAYARSADNAIASSENTVTNEVGSNNTIPSDIPDGIMPVSETGSGQEILDTNSYFVNSDMYFFNEEVTVDMPINGNVFIFGSNVTVSSPINGNVFVMGDNVTIDSNATIYGSIFAFGNSFTMNGSAYDIYAAGSKITLGQNATIDRDVKSFSSELTLIGNISRSVYSAAETINVSNTATIGKDFNYCSKNEISLPEGSVTGDVHFTQMKAEEKTRTIGDYVSSILSQAIFVFAISLVCLGIAPKFSEKASTVLKKKWGASIGLGLAGLVGIPMLAFLLLTTGIATDLSIYTFTLYGLLLASGFTVVCIAVNHILATKWNPAKKWMPILSIFLVAIVLGILKLIPFIGFALTTFGLGIFIVSLFYHPEKKEA